LRAIRLSLAALILCGSLSALAADQLIPRSHQYPNGKTVRFTSWSLFLICDPAWLRSESKADILALYNAYLSLVTAADESHAPLWAFSSATPWRATEIDPLQTKPYCDSLAVIPRQGPFLVITVHPPETISPPDAKVLVAFGGQRAAAITRSLMTLVDQATDGGPFDARVGSREWWRRWEHLSIWSRRRLPGTTILVQSNKEPQR
jgi:hypothetical protein